MIPARHELKGSEQELLHIRRRLYLAILVAVMLGVFVAFIALEYLGSHPVFRVALPAALVVLGTGFFLLWSKMAYLRLVEWGVTGLGVTLTLGMLALSLFSAAESSHGMSWLTFVSWAPIMYPWFYLTYGSRRGLIASGLFLSAALLLGVSQGIIVWQALGTLPDLSGLLRFIITSVILITASYASAYFLERHAAARAKAETVAEFAYRDALTGLPNRVLLQDRLELMLAHARRHEESFAVLFIDLDGFKSVNDTYGHQVGDELLQQVALRFIGSLREEDTVARISGDEFAVIAVGIKDQLGVTQVVRKLLDNFKRPFVIGGRAIMMTSSIGVSLYPGDGSIPDELLSKADAAMYRAKQLGKNRFYLYKDRPGKETGEYLDLSLHLAKALERHELGLHYQPIFDLNDNRLVGLEALARWQHPKLGSIPPAVFIPLAETNGLIDAIGNWVLRTACEQAKAWQDAAYPALRVSVNVSALQFSNPHFVGFVASTLQDTGLEARWLELEVTESVVAEEAIAAHLKELRKLGVRVVLDDFGTGYSSLSQLQHLPIDGFKIDRSFMGAARSPQDALDTTRVLVKTVVMLARGLGLSVVGEGVESQEQVALLQTSGCNVAQGFLLAKPMEAAEVEKLLWVPESAAEAEPVQVATIL